MADIVAQLERTFANIKRKEEKRMSRLSKAVRRISLGTIVIGLVRLAESLLGGGTGALKKKLVMEIAAVITKRLSEAGQQVPENAPVLVDELVEQAVTIMNEAGTLGGATAAPEAPAAPAAPARPRRKRRAAGDTSPKRKYTRRVVAAPVVEESDPEDFDIDDLDFEE